MKQKFSKKPAPWINLLTPLRKPPRLEGKIQNDILPALKGGVSPPKEEGIFASIHPRDESRGFLEAQNKGSKPIKKPAKRRK